MLSPVEHGLRITEDHRAIVIGTNYLAALSPITLDNVGLGKTITVAIADSE